MSRSQSFGNVSTGFKSSVLRVTCILHTMGDVPTIWVSLPFLKGLGYSKCSRCLGLGVLFRYVVFRV